MQAIDEGLLLTYQQICQKCHFTFWKKKESHNLLSNLSQSLYILVNKKYLGVLMVGNFYKEYKHFLFLILKDDESLLNCMQLFINCHRQILMANQIKF